MGGRANRALGACAALAATGALIPAAAHAAPANIGAGVGVDNVFSAAAYSHDGGTIAQMTYTGGAGPHNVTSSQNGTFGEPLFSSTTISSGSTVVNGTQYLTPGSFPFSCTVHGGMSSSLQVAGTPKPRPTVDLQIKTKKLAQAVKKSEIKVAVTITGGSGEQADVKLKLGSRRIGSATGVTATSTLKLGLTRKGRSALEKKTKAKVTVEATIDFGEPARATGRLK